MASSSDLSLGHEDLPTASPTSKPSPFRFKSKKHSRSHSSENASSEPKRHRPSHRHRRHHHRRHRSPRRAQPNPTIPTSPPIDPDTAFRESLFDALADDEGATFWKGIYGQPIHIYSPYRPASNTSSSNANDLERMSDEEYTAYVRAKMWEKSHGYILEERTKREEERRRVREKQKEEGRRMKDRIREAAAWERRSGGDSETSESIGTRKRQQVKENSKWENIWDRYLRKWEELRQLSVESASSTNPIISSSAGLRSSKPLGKTIPYPVSTLKREDVSRDAIELFMRNAARSDGDPNVKEDDSLRAVLKTERVRWHPDKIQQWYGHLGLDKGTMRSVTGVFQVLDHMWGDLKGK